MLRHHVRLPLLLVAPVSSCIDLLRLLELPSF
jgi:hypothetical protein